MVERRRSASPPTAAGTSTRCSRSASRPCSSPTSTRAGSRRGGVAPWSRSRVRGETPVVASNEELEFEKVAAAQPDLDHRGRVRPQAARLQRSSPSSPRPSRRPRASRPTPCRGTRWRSQVGASLGRRADAEELVRATRARIAAAAKAQPEVRHQQGGPDRPRRRRRRLRVRRERRAHALPRRPRADDARPRSRRCSKASSTPRSAPSGSTCSTPPTCSCSSPRASRRPSS